MVLTMNFDPLTTPLRFAEAQGESALALARSIWSLGQLRLLTIRPAGHRCTQPAAAGGRLGRVASGRTTSWHASCQRSEMGTWSCGCGTERCPLAPLGHPTGGAQSLQLVVGADYLLADHELGALHPVALVRTVLAGGTVIQLVE